MQGVFSPMSNYAQKDINLQVPVGHLSGALAKVAVWPSRVPCGDSKIMSHPEFLGNLSSRKKVKHPKRKGLGKEDLLGYTVENQHDRQGQEVNPIDAVQV